MSNPSSSRPWLMTLLMGTAVLLIAGVVVVAVLPLARCKDCAIRNAYEEQRWADKRYSLGDHGNLTVDPTVSSTPPPPSYCADCRPNGKMTLLREWLRRRQ